MPLNKEDYPDLIFKDEGEGYLNTKVKIKSFRGVNGK